MMAREQSDLNDDIDILYIHGKHGWSDLFLFLSREPYHFRITHVFSDPMSDLLELCCAIQEGQDYGFIRLPDEPGAIFLEFRRRKDKKHILSIKISETRLLEGPLSSGQHLLSFDIKANQFVTLLYYQFSKLATLHREKSYRKDRDRFPQAMFKQFQKQFMRSTAVPKEAASQNSQSGREGTQT